MKSRGIVEKAIIGCMVFIGMGGEETWFSDKKCNMASRMIFEKHAKGVHVDAIVMSRMSAEQIADEWWEECVDVMVTASNIEQYVDLLRGYEIKSRSERMGTALKMISDATTPNKSDDILAWVETAVPALQITYKSKEQTPDDMEAKVCHHLDNPDETKYLDWTLDSISKRIGRVAKQVIWLCAMPSLGKSAFVIHWGMILAKHGIQCSIASLESTYESVYWRQISQYGKINTFFLKQGEGTPNQKENVKAIMKTINPLTHIAAGGKSLDQLMSWGRSQKRQGSKILIIDNTRWITVRGNLDRINKTAAISTGMKDLRDELDIPVVVLHHSRIDSNGKEDVSWSADIKRDADMLLFLRKNEEKSGLISAYESNPRLCVDLYVDKNREGPSGMSVSMEFNREHQLFTDWLD